MASAAAGPGAGPPPERTGEIVRRLGALIPLAAGASEIAEARRDLEALGDEPGGARLLAETATGLRADEAFDLLPLAIQETLQGDPIRQHDTTSAGLVRTVSVVRVRASPEAARQAIRDRPWDWWRDGEVSDWRRTAGGGTRFVLKPLAPRTRGRLGLPAKLGIELEPAASAEESWREHNRPKIVCRARFFDYFDGPGRYEILDVAGGCLVRSVWDGVTRKALSVKILPMALFLRIHTGGEKGDLRWPFPTGTGFPGLIQSLEAKLNPA